MQNDFEGQVRAAAVAALGVVDPERGVPEGRFSGVCQVSLSS